MHLLDEMIFTAELADIFFLTRQNDSCAFDELLIRSREVIRS